MGKIEKSLIASLLAVFLLANAGAGCPGTGGGVDPYVTADTVISAAEAALPLADSIFNQWVVTQTDPAKIKAATETYQKVRRAVAAAFLLAHDAVAIARAAKQPVDITKIMAAAEAAWADLYKFLRELIPTPASQPASKTAKVTKPAEDPLQPLPKMLLRNPPNLPK